MTRVLGPLVGLTVLGIFAGPGGPRPVHVPPARAEIRPSASELVGVTAPISGTVAKVLVAPRQHVTPGTLLVELDSAKYRDALARARIGVAAARGRVSTARSGLAVRERAVRAAVRTALVTLPLTPTQVAGPAVRRQRRSDDTAVALERARTQLVAAQADVVRAAEARLAATQRAMERDQALLGQGAISARQLSEDGVAYHSALEEARAAEASLGRARDAGLVDVGQMSQGRPAGPAIAQARHTSAAAQDRLRAAQEELAAARQTLDRDKALLAEGAIPAQQLNADALAYDAARARVAAAAAAVQQAQAELEAAHRDRSRSDATSHSAPVRRPEVARAAGLVRQAQTRIREAQDAARQVAAAETEVVNAEAAVRDAELNIDRTLIRAPMEGWVTNNTVRPGDQVRSGQFLLLLSTPPQAAMRLQQLRRAGPGPGSDRRERLVQIAAEERGALTRLQAESERIKVIILGAAGAQRIGPVPAFLGDMLRRPVWGEITSGYGWRIHPIFQAPEFHTGIDIAAPWGTPVEAPADGTVIYAGQMPANGMVLILNHGNGSSTTYSHLSSYAVRIGARVRRGQIIGRIGSTGWSTGPHLFFEVRENGRPINPLAP